MSYFKQTKLTTSITSLLFFVAVTAACLTPQWAQDSASEAANPVELGTGTLLLGIPGQGPLSLEQAETFLKEKKNHAPIDFKLPFGLLRSAANVVGIKDNPLTIAKIELGRQLYFDKRLSSNRTVSCASCHSPSEGFGAHTPFGVGVEGQTGNRNSPVSYNRILSGAQFWDGRAGSLEDQAIGPIANPIEMGNTHEKVVVFLKSNRIYSRQFNAIFDGGVTIENVGKAIATFERAIVTGPSPFDYYDALAKLETTLGDELEFLDEDDPELFVKYLEIKRKSDARPMSESAKRGYVLFFSKEVNCAQCHSGSNFSDEKYHNLGVGMDKKNPDLGRFAVTQKAMDKGAFKTPTLRNVEFSAPYMHDGSLQTLMEVVDWYDQGGHPNPQLSEKIKKLKLTLQQKQDLVAFMRACSGRFPEIETQRLPMDP
ncbi:MAG: cytochrome c peroxidase [Planctomycetota bacterium]|nr:cytochrome c peroxidase [Planctomycetota bacterium]